MTSNEFIKALNEIGLELTNEQLKMLETYANYLLEYNKHTNLTAIRDIKDVYLKHFYDSLTVIKINKFSNQKILDIGTGAGFPGLVLAIIFPDSHVTLLDSNNKKIKFLKEIISLLKLENVNCIFNRAEDFANDNEEQFDIVISRAVAKLRILLELAIKPLKINGFFIAMKAEVEEEEIESFKTIKLLGYSLVYKLTFDLINNSGKRTLLKYKKLLKTNLKYPRRYDKILKEPIK